MVRMFIAIDLNEDIKVRIRNMINEFRGKDFIIKYVDLENLHITLKFLGDVSEGRVKEVEDIVSEVASGFDSFKVVFKGLGYFGTPNHVNVMWAGIKDGRDEIVELMRVLGEKLSHVRKERYDPSPHLTLGRVKSGRNRKTLLDMIERFGSLGMGDMLVKDIKLKRSELRAEGPVYTNVKVFPLRGSV